jgi:plastocyanin
MNTTIRYFVAVVAAMTLLIAIAGKAMAEEEKVITLTIKNHTFEPATLEVPAGKKFILHVQNFDNTVEEFESKGMKREKIVPALGSVKIPVGPLKAGAYEFVGEFHEDTAKGIVLAIE